jgi:hypothetical protein
MWEIYDTLIDAVPAESKVRDCLAGLHWFAVRSEGMGLAMTPREGAASLPRAGEIAGMRTRDLAASGQVVELPRSRPGPGSHQLGVELERVPRAVRDSVPDNKRTRTSSLTYSMSFAARR